MLLLFLLFWFLLLLLFIYYRFVIVHCAASSESVTEIVRDRDGWCQEREKEKKKRESTQEIDCESLAGRSPAVGGKRASERVGEMDWEADGFLSAREDDY